MAMLQFDVDGELPKFVVRPEGVMKKTRQGKQLNPKRAVAIIRASTDGVDRDGRPRQRNTAHVQGKAIEDWCRKHGIELVACFFDRISGGADLQSRKGLLAALGNVERLDAGLMVAWKRDRAVRSVERSFEVQAWCARHGTKLVSTDGVSNEDTPVGKFTRVVIDAVGELEKEIIRERIRATVASKKARGETYGVAPYGFRNEAGKLVPDEHEQSVIQQIAHMAHFLRYSERDIVKHLNERNILPRSGKPWGKTQVHNILARLTRQTGES